MWRRYLGDVKEWKQKEGSRIQDNATSDWCVVDFGMGEMCRTQSRCRLSIVDSCYSKDHVGEFQISVVLISVRVCLLQDVILPLGFIR